MSERPLVVLTEKIHPDAVERLQAEVDVRLAPGWDEGSLLCCVGEAQGIILRGLGGITRRVMEAAPRLRVIARHGAGVDNVDLVAARERGVIVTNAPGAPTLSVAEHAVGLMLAVARRIPLADAGLRAGDWGVRDRSWGIELYGRTLGVVGFGRIGRRVASICHHGLGMEVAYHDIQGLLPDPALPARFLPFDEVLQSADVLTLHVPLGPATRHLIGRRELELVKPTAILINTARGDVIDEAALAEALREGRLAGAGLDVFGQEPVQGVHPLAAFENVVLTPHIAAMTPDAMRRLAMDAAEEALAVLSGRRPRYPVVMGT